jgi:hypothetical protein
MPIGDPKPEHWREAVLTAHFDRGIRPRARIPGLAARGELLSPSGEKVPAFTVKPSTVYGWIRHEERARAGQLASPLGDLPPRDALEIQRREMLAMAHHEMRKEKRRQEKGKDLDPARMREITRWLIEIARIPDPTGPRPPTPGTIDPSTGKQVGGQVIGRQAGELLKAHRSNGAPSVPREGRTHHNTQDREKSERSAATHARTEQHTVQTGAEPGAQSSEQRSVVLGARQGGV